MLRLRGHPCSVAEFMSEVLTHPRGGFYTGGAPVFGPSGHFVTSPEISQLFGEIVGAWVAATWAQMGRPDHLQLVELGPGRGTLMADLLRATAPLAGFAAALDVRMVEVSPALRTQQYVALGCARPAPGGGEPSPSPSPSPPPGTVRRGVAGGGAGPPVTWHTDLHSVPLPPAGGGCLVVAHEFFDALPVHQFHWARGRGWCERMVDCDPDPDSPATLRFVLSPGATPAAAALVPRRLGLMDGEDAGRMGALEVSPAGMAAAGAVARRLEAAAAGGGPGGAALVVDYGRAGGPYEHSLVAIRDHEFVDLLDRPGTADLSAYVDFDALAAAAHEAGAVPFVPVPQGDFLRACGVDARLEALERAAGGAEQREALRAGRDRLVGPASEGGMGDRYQVMAIATGSACPPPLFEGREYPFEGDGDGDGDGGGGGGGDV